jgi:hypothetical protein
MAAAYKASAAHASVRAARQGGILPTFTGDTADGSGQVLVVEAAPSVDDGIPRGVRRGG